MSEETTTTTTKRDHCHNNGRFSQFRLYGFWKSSSTWRVRIALAAKGISYYETTPVNIFAGEQHADWYRAINAMGQVPVLEFYDIANDKNTLVRLSQSMAIVEFLEEAFPQGSKLIPRNNPLLRAKAYQMVDIITAGTQPLQNMPFLLELEKQSEGKIQATEVAKDVITKGLSALEQLVVEHHTNCNNNNKTRHQHCLGGETPSVVDVVLIPQLANAHRLQIDLQEVCPTLLQIEAICSRHAWFLAAHPSQQPDATDDDE